MNHKILKVKTEDFKLTCWFDDGEVVVYDMTGLAVESGSMIEPLKEKTFFKKAFVESGAVTWPNGYDICPNLIYQDGLHLAARSSKEKNRSLHSHLLHVR